jgi:hypothetical protein
MSPEIIVKAPEIRANVNKKKVYNPFISGIKA